LAARRAAVSGSCADLLHGAVGRANTLINAGFDALLAAILANAHALEAAGTVGIAAA
jgi:hypothetical protein